MFESAKYFVLSDGEEPKAIRFFWKDAIAENPRYIDIFDKHGTWITARKLVDGEYTNDF